MKKLLIDLDETLCNFKGSEKLQDWDGDFAPPAMYEKSFFEELEPLPGAMKAIHRLLQSKLFDIYICSQPVAGAYRSYSEKVAWILKYLPDLKDKIILCQDKNMIKADYLIDDNIKWENFGGTFIHFKVGRGKTTDQAWNKIVNNLLEENKANAKSTTST